MNTTQVAQAAPSFDITPRAGQSDAEINGWFRIKFPNGMTDMSERLYWGACLEDRSTNDKSDAAYYEWYERLTERQRDIAETAKSKKAADPKVIADRKKKLAQDPKYQKYKAEKRDDYKALADEEGRTVRGYNSGTTESQKDRTLRLNEKIRNDLANKINPYPVDKYDGRDNINDETIDKHHVRYMICDFLIKKEFFDQNSTEHLRMVCDFLNLPIEETKTLMAGALNSLRSAGATRKSDGKVFLHGDVMSIRARVESEADNAAMEGLPGFGAF